MYIYADSKLLNPGDPEQYGDPKIGSMFHIEECRGDVLKPSSKKLQC